MTQSGLIAETFDAGNMGEAGKLDTNINSQTREEAVGALTMLGFAQAPSSKVVTEILRGNPDMPVEQVIKQALKLIK
jgi:Holliday junction DNA helicase RuvA